MQFEVGMKVRYEGTSKDVIRFGSNGDPMKAGLVPGEVYTIANVEPHTWHTKVTLKEIGPSFKFNSVSFQPQELLLG